LVSCHHCSELRAFGIRAQLLKEEDEYLQVLPKRCNILHYQIASNLSII